MGRRGDPGRARGNRRLQALRNRRRNAVRPWLPDSARWRHPAGDEARTSAGHAAKAEFSLAIPGRLDCDEHWNLPHRDGLTTLPPVGQWAAVLVGLFVFSSWIYLLWLVRSLQRGLDDLVADVRHTADRSSGILLEQQGELIRRVGRAVHHLERMGRRSEPSRLRTCTCRRSRRRIS